MVVRQKDGSMAGESVDRWQLLVLAALASSDGDPTARFAQLATVDRDGSPYNRTVVIRAFRSETDELHVVTDVRSRKIEHLRERPRAALCWYLTASRQQFRFRGSVTLVDAAADGGAQDLRRSTWAALSPRTLTQFAWPAPGTPKTAGILDPPSPLDEPAETFVLLRIRPDVVDHLVLTSTPHRRTFYRLDDTGHWHGHLVNP
jgi:pyridoxamine 5'-phosphate oxidase